MSLIWMENIETREVEKHRFSKQGPMINKYSEYHEKWQIYPYLPSFSKPHIGLFTSPWKGNREKRITEQLVHEFHSY